MELADEGGIEALTMRRLARALGVETMTTYYHAANKEDILAAITDRVVGAMDRPAPGGDWKAAIRASATSTHEALRQHPWAAELLMSSTRISPERLRHMEGLLACLREAGFADELADHAYHAIDIHVLGFALWEARLRRTIPGPLSDLAAAALRDPMLAAYPHVVEHVEFHQRLPSGRRAGTFEFGLDLLLDGLERALVMTGRAGSRGTAIRVEASASHEVARHEERPTDGPGKAASRLVGDDSTLAIDAARPGRPVAQQPRSPRPTPPVLPPPRARRRSVG